MKKSLGKNKDKKIDKDKQSEAASEQITENVSKDSLGSLVRIEYPGHVKDFAKAIDTLGGINGIQLAIGDFRSKLKLNFHFESPYNKHITADKNNHPGILIRVQEIMKNDEKEIKYDTIGLTSTNFTFNKLCDFQYLPVTQTEYSGTIEYQHNKIMPKDLPNLNWFLSEEIRRQPKFFTPTSFVRFDTLSDSHLYLDPGERLSLNFLGQDIFRRGRWKSSKHTSLKKITILVDFYKPNIKIPQEPLPSVLELIKLKELEEEYEKLKKLFDERPICSREVVQYKTDLILERTKKVLPAVAYFCKTGPWRMTWIRFGYDPTKDFNARIYQTLDYRIKHEGIKIKVEAKRGMYKMCKLANTNIGERSYIFKPEYLPPARQMFYQYCDVTLPEIQDMLLRLPKPPSVKYDLKNGWFPASFPDHCREVISRYVEENVQKALLEDSMKAQSLQSEAQGENITPATYCSKTLDNIRRGVHTNVNSPPVADIINLTEESNQGDKEENYIDYVINSIPENMGGNSDDDNMSSGSDIDIDMEAVEEINELIGRDD